MHVRTIDIYRACNQACVFCNVADRLDGSAPPAEEVRAAIDAARADGVDRVDFVGGEPAMSPHLVRALAYGIGIGLDVGFVTNGRVLDDEGKIGRLVAMGVAAVTVSVHADDAALHAALTGSEPLAWTQALGALGRCAPHFTTTLRMVLTTRNLGQVDALIDRCASMGIGFELRALEPRGAAARRGDLVVATDRAWHVLRGAEARASAAGVPFSHHGFERLPPDDAPMPLGAAEATPWRIAHAPTSVRDAGLRGGLAYPEVPESVASAWGVPLSQIARAAAWFGTPFVALPPEVGGCSDGGEVPFGIDDRQGPFATPLVAGSPIVVAVPDPQDDDGLLAVARAWTAGGHDVRVATPIATPGLTRTERGLSAIWRRWTQGDGDAAKRAEAFDAIWSASRLEGAQRVVAWADDEAIVAPRARAAGIPCLWVARSADVLPALRPDDGLVWPFATPPAGVALHQVLPWAVPSAPVTRSGARSAVRCGPAPFDGADALCPVVEVDGPWADVGVVWWTGPDDARTLSRLRASGIVVVGAATPFLRAHTAPRGRLLLHPDADATAVARALERAATMAPPAPGAASAEVFAAHIVAGGGIAAPVPSAPGQGPFRPWP